MADITRLEQFLNHIAHPEDPIPAPVTRMEQNLVEIAENKGGGGDLEQIKTDGGVGWYECEEVIPTLTIHPSDWVLNNVVWSYPYPSMPEIVGGEKYRFTVNGQTTIVTADQEWVADKGWEEDWVIGAWFDNSPDAPESDIELNKDIYPISERPTEDFTIRLEKVTTHTIAPNFVGGSDTIVLHFDEDGIADKTITEVLDALRAGKRVIWVDEGDGYLEVNEVYSYTNDGTEELPHGYLVAFVASYDHATHETFTSTTSFDVNPVDGSIYYQ